jgi:hypothetical protein
MHRDKKKAPALHRFDAVISTGYNLLGQHEPEKDARASAYITATAILLYCSG